MFLHLILYFKSIARQLMPLCLTADKDEAPVETGTEDSIDSQELIVKATRPQGRSVQLYCSLCVCVFSFVHCPFSTYTRIVVFPFIFLILRYKKRERGKLVHGYSSKDLEGILVSSKLA